MRLRARARRFAILTSVATLASLAAATAASAHAEITPAVAPAGRLQLYTLAVPTEKAGATTTRIAFTVPSGFSIDSLAPAPAGWTRRVAQTGTGPNAVITTVTWTGGHVPAGEDSVFSFLAQPASASSYRFGVQQTYSDGSIVNWNGPENSENPAPTVTASSSFGGGGGGGGGSMTLAIIALVVGVLGLIAGGFALASRSTRALV